jgi:hypothetical protein
MGVKHNLVMPKLGLTMTEATLTEWRVEPGQRVRQGEVLFVVETEKVANEIEASAAGMRPPDLDGVAAAAFLNGVADNLARPLELIRPIIGRE